MNDFGPLIHSYDERERRGFFGLQGNLYVRGTYFRIMRERYLSRANGLLKGLPGSIIDLGCNAGDKTESLLRHFPERKILGIDIHPSSIKKGRERFKGNSKVKLEVGNAMELSSSIQGRVAGIFTSQMLHHFDLEERSICLDEVYKILPEGGVLIVSDTFIEENSKVGMLLKNGYMRLAKSDAYHNIPPKQLQKEVESIGFKMIDRIDSCPPLEKITGFYPTTMMIFQKPKKEESST